MANYNPREEAETALKQARLAAKRGDAREAERWSRIAERMAAAAEKLGALPRDSKDEAALREEIMGRLMKLKRANDDLMAWQQEDAIYQALKRQAELFKIPAPPPIRPCPGGMSFMERIAAGEI